jgi:ribosomal protein S18 acetylase RimI-like enzyme
MNWVVEKLTSQHDRSAFDCGNTPLNNFLMKLATQYRKKNLGQTYVAVSPENRVIGYYTISTSRVDFQNITDDLRQRFPQIPVPTVLLGRLAVDNAYKDQGLGKTLLVKALRQAAAFSDSIGIAAVEVDAIDDEARGFYLKYGFTSLKDDQRHLYLPIQTVKQLTQ